MVTNPLRKLELFNKKLFSNFKKKDEIKYIKFVMYPGQLHVEASYQALLGAYKSTLLTEYDSSYILSHFGVGININSDAGRIISLDTNSPELEIALFVIEVSTRVVNEQYVNAGFLISNLTDTYKKGKVGITFEDNEEYIIPYKQCNDNYSIMVPSSGWDLSNKTVQAMNDWAYGYFSGTTPLRPEVLLTFYP